MSRHTGKYRGTPVGVPSRQRQSTGQRGEEIAANYLKRNGYRVIEKNFRCQYGEIDLICTRGSDLIFVEVRSAWRPLFGDPASTVTWPKQLKLAKTALYYLQEQDELGANVEGGMRFDVIGVDHGRRRLRHMVSAFSLDEAFPHRMR